MRYFKGDYKYILSEAVHYKTSIHSGGATLPFCSIDPDGHLVVLRGYAWDGPSGPTVTTKSFMRGSLIHDALYQLLRETEFGAIGSAHGYRRGAADRILWHVCLLDGMWKWRAAWVYRGVRLGGGPSARTKKRRVYVAP